MVAKGNANVSTNNRWCHCKSLNNQANPFVALDSLQSFFGLLFPNLLDTTMFVSFLQMAGQILDGCVGSESMEEHTKELPFSLRVTLPKALPVLVDSGMTFWYHCSHYAVVCLCREDSHDLKSTVVLRVVIVEKLRETVV